ncbi:uncharacterized protein [Antedon mediterranea]|uniref:uncharacterized protein n=1 Tax=Antedon mediterranea TaxID=105859 RepID=UPI003AF6EBDF
MTHSLSSYAVLLEIVRILFLACIHEAGSAEDVHITPSNPSSTIAVSIHEESKDGIKPTVFVLAPSSNNGRSLQQPTDGVHPTPSIGRLYSVTGVYSFGTLISTTIDLSGTVLSTAVSPDNQHSSITENNIWPITKSTSFTVTGIRATISPILPSPAMLSTSYLDLTTELGKIITEPLFHENLVSYSTTRQTISAYSTQTIKSAFVSDEYSTQYSLHSLSSQIAKIPAREFNLTKYRLDDESNLTTDNLDDKSNVTTDRLLDDESIYLNTSVNTEWVTLLPLNTTISSTTNQDSSDDSSTNHTFIVAVSLIICLFGMSALILRIGNRWKKRVIVIEEKRRERLKDSNSQNKKRPTIDKPLTVRMPSIINVRPTRNQSIRRSMIGKHEKNSKPPTTQYHNATIITTTPNSPKRNRTLEALIEIGALPKELVGAEKDKKQRPEITPVEKELLSNVFLEKWPNAFDNLGLDFDSQEEINLTPSTKFGPDTDLKQMTIIPEILSDEKDTSSSQSCTELTIENSGTESATDLKGNRYDKRRKNVKFARRSMSNDSGFSDNIRLHDFRSTLVNPIKEEFPASIPITAEDIHAVYSDDSPDGLGILSSIRDRAFRRGSKRKRLQDTTAMRHGEYSEKNSDADQSSSETGGNETASDDQNPKKLLVPSISDTLTYENEMTHSGSSNRHHNSYFRRTKPRDHYWQQRHQKACDVSTQTSYVPIAASPISWVYEDNATVLRPRSEFELDFLGRIYLAESLFDDSSVTLVAKNKDSCPNFKNV